MNIFPTASALAGACVVTTAVAGFWYYATPKFFKVGYMPTQPGGGFNHQLHAGKLGMDCRYCHTKVEVSAEANVPNVSTCYGCHGENKLAKLQEAQHKEKTEFIRTAYNADASIPWRRIHKVPDYVRNFPHHAHVNAGVSCFSCHGRIDTMPVVFQAEPLSMGWCLDCHRAADKHVVPKDKITNLQWVQQELAARAKGAALSPEVLRTLEHIRQHPPENCGACHY
jgi:hypothetical protein